MHNILEYLRKQTFKDFEVIFVLDKPVTSGESRVTSGNIRYITNLTHTIPHHNASALRNLGIQAAAGEFIQLMDDDEFFPEEYLEQSLLLRHQYREDIQKDFVLTPTLMYRKTGEIQNQ